MDVVQLMDGFDRHDDFRHIEACDVLREYLVLDQHGHQITARQKLHQHVQEGRILKARMQFHDPRTLLCFGQDVTLGTNVSKLVLLEHFALHK